ncbi:MAG: HAD hydrolase-like protein [Methylococcaceae bacterium]|jgi:phosphoglycolate phosphatase
MNIFFDLDGTLIDSKLRLYKLFCDLTGQTTHDFNSYWELKRAMYDHKWILTNLFNYNEAKYLEFSKEWMANIETDKYLSLDALFPFTLNTLGQFKQMEVPLFIVTSRHNKSNALLQLERLGLKTFFNDYFIASPPHKKSDLILKKGIILTKNDVIVGDTGIDIQTAKELKMISIAVLSGFRNMAILKTYSPDYIIKNIGELHDCIRFKTRQDK